MSYEYLKNISPIKIKFSKIEIEHLIKSWLGVSLAFAIAQTTPKFISLNLLYSILTAGLTVGIGFIIHELSHKIVAQRYRCVAEFRANFQMLMISIFISFLGIVFIAPGAVMINGYVSRKQNGIISIAGPLSNLILAVLFIPLIVFFNGTILGNIASYGFNINTWLALFNLIPFGMFDGQKVLMWNKGIYFSIVSLALIIMFGGGLLIL